MVLAEPNQGTQNQNSSWLGDDQDKNESTTQQSEIDDDEIDTSDLDHLEPKLRDAWIEMRRLDKKLAFLVKKAKKTRLETKTLIDNNKKGWEEFKLTSNYVESKLEAQITQKFYALSYPDLDDEEWIGDRSNDADQQLHTPVFKTQGPYDEMDEANIPSEQAKSEYYKHQNPSKKHGKGSGFDDKSSFVGTHSESNHSSKNGKASTTASSSKKQDKADKDFIKRNIQVNNSNLM